MFRLSIATRLVLSAALLSGMVLLIAGIVLSTVYRRTTVQSFDERLGVYVKQLVADLSSQNEAERQALGQLGEPRFELQMSGWYWQILRIDGFEREHMASRSLFGARLAKLGEEAVQDRFIDQRRGYITGPDERQLRMVQRRVDLGDEGRYLVLMAAETEEIERSITDFQLALGLTFLLLGLALVGATLLQVGYGLRPLVALRSSVAAIREGKGERIEGRYPPDVSPLAQELNLLMDVNREILNRARTQVGNLAHALKTPLSVVSNEADGHPGLLADKVHEQIGVMRHHVDYYLNRARAAALAGALGTNSEVKPAIEGLLRAFTKIYQAKDLVFTDALVDIRFRGEKQDLEEMAGNLIDNAGKFARHHVHVVARAVADADRPMVEILVDDDGPGVPEDQRLQILKRGQRLDESVPGSGLGLSIVVDLAASYGGWLELSRAELGGLRARLVLPSL